MPDTVSYAKIFGEWEGAGVYNNPDEDSYESDSIYITHSEITEKKLRQKTRLVLGEITIRMSSVKV